MSSMQNLIRRIEKSLYRHGLIKVKGSSTSNSSDALTSSIALAMSRVSRLPEDTNEEVQIKYLANSMAKDLMDSIGTVKRLEGDLKKHTEDAVKELYEFLHQNGWTWPDQISDNDHFTGTELIFINSYKSARNAVTYH